MAIEPEDLAMMKKVREEYSDGSSCAILGDCHIYNETYKSFAEKMNFSRIDTFDINGNPTYKVDLNEELPEQFHGVYDWVIDSGTIYCCFDVSTVFKNMLLMLKNKGCVVHTSNLTGWFGRGFYSVSPALFRDFYNQNNFKILKMVTKSRINNNFWVENDPDCTYLQRADHKILFQKDAGSDPPLIPNNSQLGCIAYRENKIPFTKPVPAHFIQTKGG